MENTKNLKLRILKNENHVIEEEERFYKIIEDDVLKVILDSYPYN